MAFIGRGQEGEEEKLMFYSIYFTCIQKQAIKSLGRKLKRVWQREKQFLKKLSMFIPLFVPSRSVAGVNWRKAIGFVAINFEIGGWHEFLRNLLAL